MANAKSSRDDHAKKTKDGRAWYRPKRRHYTDISVYERNLDPCGLEVYGKDLIGDEARKEESRSIPFLSRHISYSLPPSHSMRDIEPCYYFKKTLSKTEVIAVVHEILTGMREQRKQLKRMTTGQSLTHFHHVLPVCMTHIP